MIAIILGILAFLAAAAISYWFELSSRNANYHALAARPEELAKTGISETFLIYIRFPLTSSSKFAQIMGLGRSSTYWAPHLAYITNGEFVVEVPWWNKMSKVEKYTPEQTKFSLGEAKTRGSIWNWWSSKKMPGITINDDLNFVIGINVSDFTAIKKANKFKNWNRDTFENNRAQLVEQLSSNNFIVK